VSGSSDPAPPTVEYLADAKGVLAAPSITTN